MSIKENEVIVSFSIGYAGSPKAMVHMDGKSYILELSQLQTRLENDIYSKGYKVVQSARQKYPRIIIND